MRDGVAMLTWQTDTFAYAESYDDDRARYRGLRSGQVVSIGAEDAGLLVKPGVARAQLDAEVAARAATATATPAVATTPGGVVREVAASVSTSTTTAKVPAGVDPDLPRPDPMVRRYFGTVMLNPARVGLDASRIAEEVIAHLAGAPGAKITVTLEIDVRLPNGADAHVVRTVTENGNSLKFTNHAFEQE
jgi:hypothetical protein